MALSSLALAALVALAPDTVLLVLNKAEHTLVVVDPVALRVVGRVATGTGPHEVAVAPDGRTAYVTNYGDRQAGHSISVVDLGTLTARELPLDSLGRPHGIVMAGGRVYFTAEVNQAVARLDEPAVGVDWVARTGQLATHMVVASPTAARSTHRERGIGERHPADPRHRGGTAHRGRPATGGDRALAGRWGIVGGAQRRRRRLGDRRPHRGSDRHLARRDHAHPPCLHARRRPDSRLRRPRADAVVVIDAHRRAVIGRIPVPGTPIGLVPSSDGRRAFVSRSQAGGGSRCSTWSAWRWWRRSRPGSALTAWPGPRGLSAGGAAPPARWCGTARRRRRARRRRSKGRWPGDGSVPPRSAAGRR
jgi:hypothetical protein